MASEVPSSDVTLIVLPLRNAPTARWWSERLEVGLDGPEMSVSSSQRQADDAVPALLGRASCELDRE